MIAVLFLACLTLAAASTEPPDAEQCADLEKPTGGSAMLAQTRQLNRAVLPGSSTVRTEVDPADTDHLAKFEASMTALMTGQSSKAQRFTANLASLAAEAVLAVRSNKITPAVRQWANETGFVLTDLMATVAEAANADSHSLWVKFRRFGELDQQLQSGSQKAEDDHVQEASTARQAHKACRNVESQKEKAVAQCEWDLEMQIEAVRGNKTKVTEAHNVVVAISGVMPSDVIPATEQLQWVDTLLQDLAQHKEAAERLRAALLAQQAQKESCSAAKEQQKTQRDACNDNQDTLEDVTCSVAQALKMACQLYKDEHEDAKTAYEQDVADTRTREQDRIVEFKSLHQIACVLGIIGNAHQAGALANASDAIRTCYDAEPSTEELTIHYNATPPLLPCPGMPVFPCTQAYIDQEYKDLPAEAPPAGNCSWTCAGLLP